MSDKKRKFRWKHGMALCATVAVALALALAYIVGSGLADRWARRRVVEELEKATGARVELGSFHIKWRSLHVRFDGLTLHGREPAGTPPFFQSHRLGIDIHVESFWSPKISPGNAHLPHFSPPSPVPPTRAT